MIKRYKSIVFFVVLIVMNISVQAHLVDHSLRSNFNKPLIVSSGHDWAGINAKPKPVQATNFTNYPNPAVTQTTIAYTLTLKSNVVLKVIDLAGKQLAVLVKQEQAAGKQEYFWDLTKSNITSGMYILLLQVDNKTYSRKMIVQ
jgi:hypothetical protein